MPKRNNIIRYREKSSEAVPLNPVILSKTFSLTGFGFAWGNSTNLFKQTDEHRVGRFHFRFLPATRSVQKLKSALPKHVPCSATRKAVFEKTALLLKDA